MREQKNTSNEISNPVKNITESTQTAEMINESKGDTNSIGNKNENAIVI